MAIKAPLNYIGNKYRIIDDIQAFFPKHIGNFVDLFCGGCDVTINTSAQRRYANDINYHIIDIYKDFQQHNTAYILQYIDDTIERWNLSKTNKSGYEAFRNYYNTKGNPLDLYTLMCFSFNYQFRFNSKQEYNNPFGKDRSSFNEVMRQNLVLFIEQIAEVDFSSIDFTEFDYSVLKTGDFIYADPPYLLSCGSYNDGKRGFRGWSEDDDECLFEILTELSDRGVLFALSNLTEHKGQKNNRLLDWIKKNGYHQHRIKFNYDNCNYQAQNGKNVTKEVLITNY